MYRISAFFFIWMTLFSYPASAGPIEDGLAAYMRGDYEKAEEFWNPLAQKGNAQAQFWLAMLHHHGSGIWRNYTKALNWYRQAADQGHAEAQVNLGGMYDRGLGVSQDYKLAVRWYRKAADQGNIQGQYNLALMYFDGTGVTRSFEIAAKYFRLAANRGDRNAQFNLGLMYSKGQGVARDYRQARILYRKAAEQGEPDALFNLGAIYHKGLSVIQNKIQAYKFFTLSAAYSSTIPGLKRALRARDIVAQTMTKRDISEAQKLAKEWWFKFKPKSELGPAIQSKLFPEMFPTNSGENKSESIQTVGFKRSRAIEKTFK